MTNVNATVKEISPIGGTSNDGYRIGYLNGAAKAAASDTVTITNASVVEWAILLEDTIGVAETATFSTNVITLPGANTGTVSGIVYYKG